jgi:hypothetical protein
MRSPLIAFTSVRNSREVIAAKTSDICQSMLRESGAISEANFQLIGVDDLALMFQRYDQLFFENWLSNAIASTAGARLTFRLSSTMTRAGGKTIRKRVGLRNSTLASYFEIAIATRMLFMNFREPHRPVTACGLVCTNRLEALQRIMEHEILHLAEMLCWGKSSCAAPRYKTLSANIFGHASSKHELITPLENAAVEHAVKIGDRVEFEFDGKRLIGLVNRIHHRATVLVEARDGVRYRGGKTYHKYYIPLPMLRVRGAEPLAQSVTQSD